MLKRIVITTMALIASMTLSLAGAKIIHLHQEPVRVASVSHGVEIRNYYHFAAPRAIEREYMRERRGEKRPKYANNGPTPHAVATERPECGRLIVLAEGWSEGVRAQLKEIACSMLVDAFSGQREIHRHVNGNLATGVVVKYERISYAVDLEIKDRVHRHGDESLPIYERRRATGHRNLLRVEMNLRVPARPEDVPVGASPVIKVFYEKGN